MRGVRRALAATGGLLAVTAFAALMVWLATPRAATDSAELRARRLGLVPAPPDRVLAPELVARLRRVLPPRRRLTPGDRRRVVTLSASLPPLPSGRVARDQDSVLLARLAGIQVRAARDARVRGSLGEAVAGLELAERTARAVPWSGTARLLGAELAQCLAQPRLTRAEIGRLKSLVDGPVFRTEPARPLLARELARELRQIEQVAKMPKANDWDVRTYTVFGQRISQQRVQALPTREEVFARYAQAADALRRTGGLGDAYLEIFQELTDRSTAAYPIRFVRSAPGEESAARPLFLRGFDDEWFAPGECDRETVRRILDFATAVRLGEPADEPIGPSSKNAIRVSRTHSGTRIEALGRDEDARDDFVVDLPP